jgi:hypothetical protein
MVHGSWFMAVVKGNIYTHSLPLLLLTLAMTNNTHNMYDAELEYSLQTYELHPLNSEMNLNSKG